MVMMMDDDGEALAVPPGPIHGFASWHMSVIY